MSAPTITASAPNSTNQDDQARQARRNRRRSTRPVLDARRSCERGIGAVRRLSDGSRRQSARRRYFALQSLTGPAIVETSSTSDRREAAASVQAKSPGLWPAHSGSQSGSPASS